MRKVISKLGAAAVAVAVATLLAGCSTSPKNAAVVYDEAITYDYLEEFADQATKLTGTQTPADALLGPALRARFVLEVGESFDVPEADVIAGIKSGEAIQGMPGSLDEGEEPGQALVDFFRGAQMLEKISEAGLDGAFQEAFFGAIQHGDIKINPRHTPTTEDGSLALDWILRDPKLAQGPLGLR